MRDARPHDGGCPIAERPGAVPSLPFDRPVVTDIAPAYHVLRERSPIVRVRTALGDDAWMVTGYELSRSLLSDPRLGRSHPRPDEAARADRSGLLAGAVDSYDTEVGEHARMRAVLGPAFALRRMRGLTADIEELVGQLLDDLEAAGAAGNPVDLQEHLSGPLPVMVICRLLGVPYADRDTFSALCERACGLHGDDPQIAMAELKAYIGTIAEQRRRRPADDVISDVTALQAEDPSFDDDDLTGLCAGLLVAGHETTMNHISFGAVMVCTRPGVRERLVGDPGSVAQVVEESLRISAPDDASLVRYAHEDVPLDLGGGPAVPVRRGDMVLFYSPAANQDPAVFPGGRDFRPGRSPNPHLTFGHGHHFCLGAGLARIELRTSLSMLFTRFPGLRLDVGVDELALHRDRLTGGLREVPVRW